MSKLEEAIKGCDSRTKAYGESSLASEVRTKTRGCSEGTKKPVYKWSCRAKDRSHSCSKHVR
jgi:hypothetical protein